MDHQNGPLLVLSDHFNAFSCPLTLNVLIVKNNNSSFVNSTNIDTQKDSPFIYLRMECY